MGLKFFLLSLAHRYPQTYIFSLFLPVKQNSTIYFWVFVLLCSFLPNLMQPTFQLFLLTRALKKLMASSLRAQTPFYIAIITFRNLVPSDTISYPLLLDFLGYWSKSGQSLQWFFGHCMEEVSRPEKYIFRDRPQSHPSLFLVFPKEPELLWTQNVSFRWNTHQFLLLYSHPVLTFLCSSYLKPIGHLFYLSSPVYPIYCYQINLSRFLLSEITWKILNLT